jgi:bile acid:Na+ symporter, BASS family
VGIQNATLAIAITAGLLKNPDMAVPTAIYSLFAYATAIFYGRRSVQKLARQENLRANNLSTRL